MGYDLKPLNKEMEPFHLGTFSFPILLESFGYLFPCIHNGPQWYSVFGIDDRMPEGASYPSILSNDGFPVTADEARIMARMTRNFVAIQRSLPDENKPDDVRSKSTFKHDDMMAALMRGMFDGQENWPVKIREDFVDRFEKFADWAEQSGGFEIW